MCQLHSLSFTRHQLKWFIIIPGCSEHDTVFIPASDPVRHVPSPDSRQHCFASQFAVAAYWLVHAGWFHGESIPAQLLSYFCIVKISAPAEEKSLLNGSSSLVNSVCPAAYAEHSANRTTYFVLLKAAQNGGVRALISSDSSYLQHFPAKTYLLYLFPVNTKNSL